MSAPRLTLGIEEEYQIIHPKTRELTSYIQEFLDQGRVILKDQIKAEFLQSQVEVGSHICHGIAELRSEVVRLRRAIWEMAEREGLCVVAASTHPFSRWTEQRITLGERYTQHAQDMADVARQMLVFGMHLHIGIADPELRIDVMNQLRYFLPHLLALSTSSPFWHGRETGLKSYRSIILGNLPRAGIPPTFRSWSDYSEFVDTLVATRCIEEPTRIWWDIRPSPKYPTLELRFADICTRVDEAVCLSALMLAIVTKLIRLRQANLSWRNYHRALIAENKWRAVRYGIHGPLIDLGKRAEVPLPDLVGEMLEWVDDVVDDLGIRGDVEYANVILRGGTSADRQLRVFKETGSLEAVVDHLIAETRLGVSR